MADGSVILEIDLQDDKFKAKLQSLGTAAQSLTGGAWQVWTGGWRETNSKRWPGAVRRKMPLRQSGIFQAVRSAPFPVRTFSRPAAKGGIRDPGGYSASDRGGQGGKRRPDHGRHIPLERSRRGSSRWRGSRRADA